MGQFTIFYMQPIIELEKVTKRFGGITALNNASLKVNKGEVVGLIGDNGAGKSTLIKTLVGVHRPDDGDIKIHGDKVNNWNALKAREAGIETVFQDRALCPQQSIVWNIFMGKELKYPFGFIRDKEQITEANRLIREIGFTSKLINAESPVGNLSGGERQGVAIARAIYNNAELIILDEPTNNLSLNETQKVFDFVLNVKKSNRSVLFIGHNIYHVYDISDRFVILDRGEVVHHLDKENIQSPEELMKIMRDTIKSH
jgi:simple sugar transport system ATP-binding protein